MPAKKSQKVAGRDDYQVFLLKCPDDGTLLEVTNYRRGQLDRIRGIHHVKQYGWFARCGVCGQQWGSETDSTIATSLWMLSDVVQEQG